MLQAVMEHDYSKRKVLKKDYKNLSIFLLSTFMSFQYFTRDITMYITNIRGT